jgi:hypothetical protein
LTISFIKRPNANNLIYDFKDTIYTKKYKTQLLTEHGLEENFKTDQSTLYAYMAIKQ